MTTTVLIGVQGNKAVEVRVDKDKALQMLPGGWTTLTIHSNKELTVKETGEFIVGPTMLTQMPLF